MNIGPRVWKTGLAVTVSLMICQQFDLPSPIFAVIAAIVAMRPSVAQSVIEGGYRIIATLIGGLIGFIIVYYFGSGPFAIGFAVILAILACIQFNLQQAIVLTGITVTAVMVDVQGDPYIYAKERLVVTLVGIVVGLVINLLLFPPKCEKLLQDEVFKANNMLKNFYIYVVNGFLNSSGYNFNETEEKIESLRLQFETVRRGLFELKKETGYLTSNQKVKMYEKIISKYHMIFERIQGIHQTELNRNKRNIDLSDVTCEYEEILKICEQLLTSTVSMQDSLANYYVDEKEKDLYHFASTCSFQSQNLIKKLRAKISQWHLNDINHQNTLSLLEISNIGYEMEQIFRYLNEIKFLFKELADLKEKNRANKIIKNIKKLRKCNKH